MKPKKRILPIKGLREGLKLSKEQFAADLGVSYFTVVAVEEGVRKPSLELAYKIARRLNKTIEELFFASTSYKTGV